MARYTVVLDGLHAFGVEVASFDRFVSVRGFKTEAAALTWIAEQKAAERDAAEVPFHSPGQGAEDVCFL